MATKRTLKRRTEATASVRIIAPDQEQAMIIRSFLERATGGRVRLSAPREGRKGEWLSYGAATLTPEDQEALDDAPSA